MKRRSLLKLLVSGAVTGALGLFPKALLASWNKSAFAAKEHDEAIKALYGPDEIKLSNDITLKVPNFAENGAVVPVTASTTIPDVVSIGILVKDNPTALCAEFVIPTSTLAKVATRIRMAESSDVIVVVKAKDGIYQTSKRIEVTNGGCG